VSHLIAVLTLAAAIFAIAPGEVDAQTFRLVAPDGTVHYTNAPTDPSYRRLGLVPPSVVPAAAVTTAARNMYLDHVREAAGRYGVPEQVVTAVIRAESGFNPYAVSPKGARGLMQLMPQTASLLGVRDSFNPAQNIDGGVRHLRRLIDRFDNNLPLALAAYNAGEQAVMTYRGIPPYPETQDYVAKIMAMLTGRSGASAAARPASMTAPQPMYRFTDSDGTIVYSNLPRAEAARLVRR
jgi:soluble lytic murein transglycosylase-like protein